MTYAVRVAETVPCPRDPPRETVRDNLRKKARKFDYTKNSQTVSQPHVLPGARPRNSFKHPARTSENGARLFENKRKKRGSGGVPNCLIRPILPHRLKPSHKSHTASPSQTVSQIPYCLTVSNCLTNPILPHRLKPSHKSHTASPSQTVSQISNCLIVSNRLTPATEECGHARLRRHHSKRVYTNLTPRSPQ